MWIQAPALLSANWVVVGKFLIVPASAVLSEYTSIILPQRVFVMVKRNDAFKKCLIQFLHKLLKILIIIL